MRFKLPKYSTLTNLICFLVVCISVSSFSYWFYQIGQEDKSIQTLSWIVSNKKIVIDPGHGGIFPGKVGKGEVLEKEINLAVANKLAGILNETGSMVIMSRSEDTDLVNANKNSSLLQKQKSDLEARVALATKFNADLFISIHCNSIPSEKWYGAQTFYDPDSKESEALGKSIQAELIRQLKNTKRQALVRSDTFIFRNLDIPAVIIECGFLSNPKEAELLTDPEYQHRLAFAIYSGLVKYLSEETEKVTN